MPNAVTQSRYAMTMARSSGWMRIECLFHRALRMLRKSASRIVASRHLVKKSLRLASILFAPSLRRIDSGSPFFTYALSMDYVLGFDGGGTKTECVLMDPAGKILARSFAGPSNPSRVGAELATREIEKAADLSLQEARVARSAVAALGAGLAGRGETGTGSLAAMHRDKCGGGGGKARGSATTAARLTSAGVRLRER